MPATEPVEACPLCGEPEREELWTLPDRLYGVAGSYRYVRCGECESVYQSPRVRREDLHLCYPSGYYTHSEETEAGREAPSAEERGLRALRDRVRWWIRWAVQGDVANERVQKDTGPDRMRANRRPGPVARLLGWALSRSRAFRERAFFGLIDPIVPRSASPGRALEIGAGSGWELSLLRRMGWETEGVEFDPAAAETAARDHGLSVRVGDFLDVVPEDERYDLIYLSHVFEHLPDPEEAFRFFGRHLRSAGRVVLVFPNLHCLGVRLWERHWQGWDPPRHLVLPSHRGIRALSRRTGLRARIETRARDAPFILAASRAIEERFGDSGRFADSDPDGSFDTRASSDPSSPRRRAADRVLALFEGILVAVGLPLGEETVVVLEGAE